MTQVEALAALRAPELADALHRLDNLIGHGQKCFLLGAGSSRCAGLPLTAELTEELLQSASLDEPSKQLLNAVRTQFADASNATFEDFLSEIVDLHAITQRRDARASSIRTVNVGGVDYDGALLQTAIDKIKLGISAIIGEKRTIETHRSFVRATHRNTRDGRSTGVVDYLVLNYDTVLEDALAFERIPYADGIDGGASGWWNPLVFDREGLGARVLKLHGSIDWVEQGEDVLPRRIGSFVQGGDASSRRILIWPASTKYRETQLDPYAQILARARSVLRPNFGEQRVLTICGYSFGDAHINVELDRALGESAGSLTVLVLTSEDQPTGLVKQWLDSPAIRDRVLVYAKRGFFHGGRSLTVDTDLPWWQFEVFTRLLGGER
ncbi:MAG: SIR2 family protein [Gemmatimonadetes bacterium]|jgi:hypothetical protein|nr:SIR2 family protein [Gemmatimonadota bacterium]MBK6844314.1 SIR2 family protein [Gemmatimonadota bacterium]MBK8058145.1 SIR2 family protein [Gemmatimonadota bacterium]MBK9409548.1 SIR2 family protein [Gemmatimonadota bacterium]MBK9980270.1 SIR2 family protein [Gemmatimonadota bacterium]